MIIVTVRGIDFKVNVIHKRYNRRIYLRVKEGIITITTPTRLTQFSIKDMIDHNFNSIRKFMQESDKVEDRIHFLGKIYILEYHPSDAINSYIIEEKIIVEAPHPDLIGKSVELLYNAALKNIVETYGEDIFKKFDLNFPIQFDYKNVKGYYGECFPKKKRIILASRLAKYDLKYILSVLYHECAHFKYQNHQEQFYAHLEERYPSYKKIQKELRSIKYNEKY